MRYSDTAIFEKESVLIPCKGKTRYLREVALLSQAYALAKPDPATFANAEEIAFFQAGREFSGYLGGLIETGYK